MFRALAAALIALPFSASADFVVESLQGDVTVGDHSKFKPKPGQRVFYANTPIRTGPGGQASLRFEDGMRVLLHENSELRVPVYTYNKDGSSFNGRALLDLARGSARVVTGYIALNNPRGGFTLSTPQASLTTRGWADFSVAIVNPLYLSVGGGTVFASNPTGEVGFPAGSTASVASNAAAPEAISAASLPSQARLAFVQMNQVALAPPAGGTAAGLGPEGALGSVDIAVPALVIGAGVVAGIAALAGGTGEDEPAQVTPPSHH